MNSHQRPILPGQSGGSAKARCFPRRGRAKPDGAAAWLEVGKRAQFTTTEFIVYPSYCKERYPANDISLKRGFDKQDVDFTLTYESQKCHDEHLFAASCIWHSFCKILRWSPAFQGSVSSRTARVTCQRIFSPRDHSLASQSFITTTVPTLYASSIYSAATFAIPSTCTIGW